jgi:hypothetical protein
MELFYRALCHAATILSGREKNRWLTGIKFATSALAPGQFSGVRA